MSPPLASLARLAVDAGAHVAAGQTVVVSAKLGHEELVREIAAACYDRGAHHVQVDYSDPWVSRARLLRAPEEALGTVPPWVRERPGQMAALQAAWIGLSGPPAPGVLDDVDPGRIGRDTPALVEWAQVIDRRQIGWTIVPGPTEAWGRLVYGEDEADPLGALWNELAVVLRLDEADPGAAWWQRSAELRRACERLEAARLDSLRFRGPGTDLTVGLLPGTSWQGGGTTTAWGRDHMPNLPTEEVFTSPDPERTEGTVTSTKPLLVSGRAVTGLTMRFAGGRAVDIEAEEGGDLLRHMVRRDVDADRLGEVALVDGSGRVGRTGRVFYDTLLDENAASHIALGSAYTFAVEGDDVQRANSSAIHVDFMIGSSALEVDGVTGGGDAVPVLRDGRWQI
jgi:aminopeptidase